MWVKGHVHLAPSQALLEYVCEVVNEGEQERGVAVLLSLSASLAVHNMAALHGNSSISL